MPPSGSVGVVAASNAVPIRTLATMGRWTCNTCGWEYDPATGDPEGGVPPGTPFEAIPDDWHCPDCGAGKDQFEFIEA